jgi:hypothetical protein
VRVALMRQHGSEAKQNPPSSGFNQNPPKPPLSKK